MSTILSKIAATVSHEALLAAHFVENLLGSSVGQSISEAAAEIVTQILLQAEISDTAERAKVANYVYSVASGIHTLSTGSIPSVETFSDYLAKFTDGSALLLSVISALSSEYSKVYASLENEADASKAIAFFEALAAGVEAGAASYITPATTPAA